jgi:hypothetical protein
MPLPHLVKDRHTDCRPDLHPHSLAPSKAVVLAQALDDRGEEHADNQENAPAQVDVLVLFGHQIDQALQHINLQKARFGVWDFVIDQQMTRFRLLCFSSIETEEDTPAQIDVLDLLGHQIDKALQHTNLKKPGFSFKGLIRISITARFKSMW